MEQIFEYIAFELKNPSAAVGQIADFQNALENVCSFPESCPCTGNEYVKERSLRKLIVNNYIVFYRVTGDEIQVEQHSQVYIPEIIIAHFENAEIIHRETKNPPKKVYSFYFT